MKIKELIEEVAPSVENNTLKSLMTESGYSEKRLNAALIRTYLSKIKKCEEFEDSEVLVVTRPVLEECETDRHLSIVSLKLGEDIKFKNRCYLYSLTISSMGDVVARGLFENWEIEGKTMHDETYNVDLDGEPKFSMVFYLEKEMADENKMNMKLSSKVIPIELQEAYYDKFGRDFSNVTEKMIDDFLSEHEEKK
jgi:hypothetical protein